MSGHPRHPSEITAAWLDRTLRDCGALAGGSVSGIDTEIIGQERGFTGVIARVTITYDVDAAGGPQSIVAKFPLAERAVDSSYRRAQSHPSGVPPQLLQMAVREAEFYRLARDEVDGLADCYFSHVDGDAGQAVMLLEDLSAGKPGDALAGCSVAKARSVLAAMAEIHGRWWRDESLSSLDWLGDWAAANQRRADRFRDQAGRVVDVFSNRLPEVVIDLIERLVEPYGEILAEIADAPVTLIHADLHLDNVMFMPDGEGVAARIIDWQGSSCGPAVLDLAGFLAESLEIEERRAHEVGLLRQYHESLDASAVGGYSFGQLFDDYRRALCVRVAGQVGWLARVIDHPPSGREQQLVDALFDPGRVFAALLDHGIEPENALSLREDQI